MAATTTVPTPVPDIDLETCRWSAIGPKLVVDEIECEARGIEPIITDGPRGVGGPVVASLGGATSALIVAELTVSGGHEVARAIDLCGDLKVPVRGCVNTFDLNPGNGATIDKMVREGGFPVVGRVPFDPVPCSSTII